MSVKRYLHLSSGITQAKGEWVKYSSYHHLEAEKKNLEAENAELKSSLDHANMESGGWFMALQRVETENRKLTEEVERLTDNLREMQQTILELKEEMGR